MSDSQAWKAEIRSSDHRASGLLWSVLGGPIKQRNIGVKARYATEPHRQMPQESEG
jgi:hypothetical protein